VELLFICLPFEAFEAISVINKSTPRKNHSLIGCRICSFWKSSDAGGLVIPGKNVQEEGAL
jgi:hypothetical protein